MMDGSILEGAESRMVRDSDPSLGNVVIQIIEAGRVIVINASNPFTHAFNCHAITTNLNIDHFFMEGISPKLRLHNAGMVSGCLLWASDSIVETCDEVSEGEHFDWFVLHRGPAQGTLESQHADSPCMQFFKLRCSERSLLEMVRNVAVTHLLYDASVEPVL